MPPSLIVSGDIRHLIHTARGQRVILDLDLARLYDVPTKALNQAVKRNQERFPEAFMFQLTPREAEGMRSQIVTASKRNVRFMPYAFTEHGALMAANVLNSRRAIQMSVRIVMAFVHLRRMTLSIEGLSRKLDALESTLGKHDGQFKMVFNALRQLMSPPPPPRRRIGFRATED